MASANTHDTCNGEEIAGGSFYFTSSELIAGSVAGFVEHFAMFPFDTIKTRIQGGSSSSIFSTVRQIWHDEPLTHLYRGLLPILFSAIPSHAAYFGAYEAGKRMFGEESNLSILASAACAVTAHDSIATPFDVVKQRMQMDGRKQFTSSLRCAQQIHSENGFRIFFASLPTTILMNIPYYGAYWTVYEGFLSFLGGERRDKENELAVEYVTAGMLAGATASIVSSPLDVVKTHLQLGSESRFLLILQNIIRTRGMRGLLAGVYARIMYTAPSSTLMMITYEGTKKTLEKW